MHQVPKQSTYPLYWHMLSHFESAFLSNLVLSSLFHLLDTKTTCSWRYRWYIPQNAKQSFLKHVVYLNVSFVRLPFFKKKKQGLDAEYHIYFIFFLFKKDWISLQGTLVVWFKQFKAFKFNLLRAFFSNDFFTYCYTCFNKSSRKAYWRFRKK